MILVIISNNLNFNLFNYFRNWILLIGGNIDFFDLFILNDFLLFVYFLLNFINLFYFLIWLFFCLNITIIFLASFKLLLSIWIRKLIVDFIHFDVSLFCILFYISNNFLPFFFFLHIVSYFFNILNLFIFLLLSFFNMLWFFIGYLWFFIDSLLFFFCIIFLLHAALEYTI